ncbi:DUF6328 family protein [Actinocorallia sp. A-T 12471]|uniref:DUF6328 family protein n=1 Tax=Actinocorallia sp. A-T 12471 TaxID=3089813 RepID=UPI0029D2457F|nr:DUF6328 family protein [Actinocorallia sp. A-T 12471]MDX6740135.1 DUF6328 family protein [Actinocorallia sp. A-T 12471]
MPQDPLEIPDGKSADAKATETPAERADRNFVEFLQGIRVAVTGVQVLFAFLLTVPFSPGFAGVRDGERTLFYLALVSAALASLFFIAPVAQHRILFRQGLKEPLVKRANVYGLIGTAALAVSMTTAAWLVIDHLFDGLLPSLTAAGIVLLASWLWFIEPALHRNNNSG